MDEKVEAEDRFVIASDLRHNKHLFEHLPADNTKILTWFAERNQDDSIDTYKVFLPKVDLLIADRYDYLEQLQVAYPEEAKKLKHMASFDTRLALGTSQRVKESKIFYQVDFDQLDLEAIYPLKRLSKVVVQKINWKKIMKSSADFLSKTCVTRLPLSRPFSLHDSLST